MTKDEELDLLRDIYNNARRFMRYQGTDRQRAEQSYNDLKSSVHDATYFYNDPDKDPE